MRIGTALSILIKDYMNILEEAIDSKNFIGALITVCIMNAIAIAVVAISTLVS